MASNCSAWMESQEGQSPYTTAQLVGQLCNSGYTVSSTNFQENQYIPNNTTANACTCSWASYNLLSACAVCAGQVQLTSWSTWIANCGSFVSSTTYLPYTLPVGEGIPFWSGTNPATWTNQTFNVTQAAAKVGATGDLTGAASAPSPTTTSTTSSSKTPVGAIVGGVIGGVVIILMLIGYMLFMKALRRRRQRASKDPLGIIASTTLNGVHFVSVPTTPPRAPSSMAQAYPQAQSTGPTPPLSPYMSSHEHSVASLNLMSLTSPTSPRFTANMTPPITDAADMISPFFVTSPSRPQEGGNTATSKAAEAQIERVLSPPGQRARLNPPPYSAASPTASSGSAPPSRRLSLKQTLKRKGSTSGGTMHSGHSAASTRGSGKGRPRAARMTSDGSVDSTGSAGTANSAGRGAAGSSRRAMSRVERTNTSDARPPAV